MGKASGYPVSWLSKWVSGSVVPGQLRGSMRGRPTLQCVHCVDLEVVTTVSYDNRDVDEAELRQTPIKRTGWSRLV